MKAYASALLGLSLLLSIGARLLYDRRYGAVTGLLFSLILLTGVAEPLASLVDGELSLPSVSIEADTAAFEQTLREAYESGVQRALCERFDLAEEQVAVTAVDFSFEDMTAAQVYVVLSGRAALADRHRIEAYLNEGGVRVCEIRIQME